VITQAAARGRHGAPIAAPAGSPRRPDRRAGRIGVLGFSSEPSAIVQAELTKKELTLAASRLNCAMFPQVIDWIARGLIQPEHIVTHKVGFRDVARAFEMAERNPAESCKILLDFAGG